jgi:hypothetical protein
MAGLSIRFSRRKALQLGVGIAVTAAVNGPAKVALASGANSLDERDVNGVPIDGTGEVVDTNGQTVLVRMADGHAVSATLVGFPIGIAPRPGDLVAVDSRPQSRPYYLKPQEAASAAWAPVALPLCRWSVGTPKDTAGVTSIGSLRLAPSVKVAKAAEAGTMIAICTMDSVLSDRQLLATRPV